MTFAVAVHDLLGYSSRAVRAAESGLKAKIPYRRLTTILRKPPAEPCASELEFLTPAEYDEAFNTIVRLYQQRIIRHIAGITRDFDNAADLAQEVFISIYRGRVSFEKAYLYRAAKNVAYGALRQTWRRRRLETRWAGGERQYERRRSKEPEVADPRPLQDAELLERARREAVKMAVERLPEKFRVPLVLLAQGKSYRQIAEVTRASVKVVASRICWGKSILRRRLRAYL